MPAAYLFTTTYTADDVRQDWYYEAATPAAGRRLYYLERYISSGALTGGVPVGSPDPSNTPDGFVLYGPNCEGGTSVTVSFVAATQTAALQEEENAPSCVVGLTCDLYATLQTSGSTLLLSPVTSHPPVFTRIVDALGAATAWVEGKLQYDFLPGGAGRVYLKDAGDGGAPCVADYPFTISGSGAGTPTGDLIDTFTTGGVTYQLYYQSAPTRLISAYSTPRTQVQEAFTEAERGRADGEKIDAVCEGSTLVTWRAALSYPYATIELEEDSTTCGVPPITPCTLSVLVEPTPESATGGDGTALALVTGAQGPVTYSLDDHQTAGQPDPLFTNLLAGDYTLTVREDRVNGCVARADFTIAAPRALRYRLPWCDRTGRRYEARLIRRGYTGPVEELRGLASPCLIDYTGSTNDGLLSNPVQASSAELNILVKAGNDLRDTFCPDERYMLVEIWDVDGDQLEWCGWLTPSLFDAEHRCPPYNMTLRATDGLGGLSGITYGTPIGGLLEGMRADVAIIQHCLRLLDYRLPLSVACNLYAARMPATLADDPLGHVYRLQQGLRTDKGTGLSCRQVLELLLGPLGAVLRQERGRWQLVRQQETLAVTLYERHYDASGARVGGAPTPRNLLHAINRPDADLIWLRMQQAVTALPAVGGVTLTADPGEPLNLLADTAWAPSAFTGQHLTRWKGKAKVRREAPVKKNDAAGLRFLENHNIPEWVQSPPVPIGWLYGQPAPDSTEPNILFGRPTLSFTARFDEDLGIPESDTGDPQFELTYPLIQFAIQVGTQWKTSLFNNDLQATPHVFSVRHYPVRGEKTYVFHMPVAYPAPVAVRLYELQNLVLTNVKLTNGEEFSEEHTDDYRAENTSAGRITTRDEATFSSGDTLGTVFFHTPLLADASPTVRWYTPPEPDTSGLELLDYQAGLRLLTQQRRVQVLSGLVRGELRRGDLVTDVQEPEPRVYYQTAHRWDVAKQEHAIRMVELIGAKLPPAGEGPQGGMRYESGALMRYEDGLIMQHENGN